MKERLFDIPPESREAIVHALSRALEDERDIAFAYLHGSFLTGGPFHDVDVAVVLDGELGAQSARALALVDRLSSAAGYPIDVRAISDAPLAFQFRALLGTPLVVRDDKRLADFMERVGRRYLDIAPVLRQAAREAFVR